MRFHGIKLGWIGALLFLGLFDGVFCGLVIEGGGGDDVAFGGLGKRKGESEHTAGDDPSSAMAGRRLRARGWGLMVRGRG